MKYSVMIFGVVAAAVAAPVAAQQPVAGERIGHIAAVVGDSVITNFDVQAALAAFNAQRQQRGMPPLTRDSAGYSQLVGEVLENRISELLILQAAQRDTTIRISPDQLNRRVEDEERRMAQRFGGAVQFEQALRSNGLTLAKWREDAAAQLRGRYFIDTYLERMRQERRSPPVSEREMRDHFERQRGTMPMRPPAVTFEQVIVTPKPSPEALALVKQRADSVYNLVRSGEDFAQLARRFSEDPVSREQGGDLQWFRPGTMVKEFEDVAFSLRPGQVSPPVLTSYGYHIIKVERARGAEIQARHILFRAPTSTADGLAARARADTVATLLRQGGNARELAERYGAPDQRVRGGPTEVDTLAAALGVDMASAGPGDVIGPVAAGGDDVAAEFIVMRILTRDPEREWTFEELRPRLRAELEREKLIDEVIAELRRSTLVDIRTGT